MLAHSGTPTGVITTAKGRRPDFVVENGLSRYPVEVKRPAGKVDPRRLISEAAKQTEIGPRYHGGAIVVDLTDCLPERN